VEAADAFGGVAQRVGDFGGDGVERRRDVTLRHGQRVGLRPINARVPVAQSGVAALAHAADDAPHRFVGRQRLAE